MDKLNKNLEIITNFAIILAAVALIGTVTYKFLLTGGETSAKTLKDGSEFSMLETNWAENKKSLVLVLQKDCHFCSESSSFYKTLSERNRNNKQVKLIAAFPQSVDEGKNYLSEQGIAVDEVRKISFGKGIDGTPTLVLVDEKGSVVDSWEGKLTVEEEQKVLEKLNL
jgi:thioredoxin-related protein